ncbi:hypothetical protein BO71DRAFT_478889 [Aspergillus ellipticus CBS 707.79]|uniref:Uncharacterized protein n=1 Tax=Aspergillus ellipticus CBS 707.79 TaxID=1448320 RepID=A0A319F4P1_9EURO|nr:hypothetical protein BO71DRAFT_478889 [Aspergillus ellipticus CBS 707.79]
MAPAGCSCSCGCGCGCRRRLGLQSKRHLRTGQRHLHLLRYFQPRNFAVSAPVPVPTEHQHPHHHSPPLNTRLAQQPARLQMCVLRRCACGAVSVAAALLAWGWVLALFLEKWCVGNGNGGVGCDTDSCFTRSCGSSWGGCFGIVVDES